MARLPVVSDPHKAWQAYQLKLQSLTVWQVEGYMGVRARGKSISGNVIWQYQGPKNYRIDMYGPLGIGETLLFQKPNGMVTLLTSNHKTVKASSPEVLMQENLGWSVPLTGLVYWVRGLPVAGVPYKSTLSKYGVISHLEQSGWQIELKDYRMVKEGLPLPTDFILKRNGLFVRLQVNQWSLSA